MAKPKSNEFCKAKRRLQGLEPWTLAYRLRYIGWRGDATCNQHIKRNQYKYNPERQIQSQLRTMFQLIMVRK